MSESAMFEFIDIKYEISGTDPDLDPERSSSNSNRGKYEAVYSEQQIQPDDIEFSFLHSCDRNCETCQKYIRKLREHVRITHAHGGGDQLIHDPLHIEVPSVTYQSFPAVEIKCEVEEVESMDCASETQILFHSGDNNEGENNSDNSTTVTPKSTPQNLKEKAKRNPSTHTGERCDEAGGRMYKCDECDKSFTRSNNLRQHKRSHTGERAHKCDECEESFARSDTLIHHKKIQHFMSVTYKCDVCDKIFTAKSHLIRHKKIHIGERDYKCDECDKCFTQSGTLTRHKATHTGERPYECDQCEKSYTRADKLTDHMKIHRDPEIIQM